MYAMFAVVYKCCRGRAVTNVVRTCSPTPLLKRQLNMFKLHPNIGFYKDLTKIIFELLSNIIIKYHQIPLSGNTICVRHHLCTCHALGTVFELHQVRKTCIAIFIYHTGKKYI